MQKSIIKTLQHQVLFERLPILSLEVVIIVHLLTASLCWPLEEKLDNPSFDKSVSLGNRLFVLMGTTTQSARNFVFFSFSKLICRKVFVSVR